MRRSLAKWLALRPQIDGQDRPPGLKFSSEIETFKRAAHQTVLLWGILKVRIENFKQDSGVRGPSQFLGARKIPLDNLKG